MTWTELLRLIQGAPSWLVPIICILAAGFLLFRVCRAVWRAWPTIKQFVVTVNAITGLPEFMKRTDASIATMRRQIENDHKTNMRDDITDAQETAKRVEEGVRGLHEKHEAVEQRLEVVVKAIDELRASDDDIRSEIEHTRPHPLHPQPKEKP